MRYNLVPGIKYVLEGADPTEEIDNPRALLKTYIEEHEELGVNAGATLSIAVYFWDCLMLDGALLLDGSKMLDEIRRDLNPTAIIRAKTETTERIETVSLRTVRNLAHIDGSLMLDGSRVLNSIDRKEEL